MAANTALAPDVAVQPGLVKLNSPAARMADLATHAARIDQAVVECDLLAVLRALDGAVQANCLERTHPATISHALDFRVVAEFAGAFATGLDYLPARPADDLTGRRQRKLIESARARAGRGALLLSGGGTLGNYHIGVVRTLMAERLLPEVISGSSAGSLIAAVVGTRDDAALDALFANGAPELASAPQRSRLDGPGLRRTVDRLVPNVTFAEARERSGRAINIVVSGVRGAHGGLVLNARTTPDVLLRDAVMASCAVPFVFAPVELRMRDARGRVSVFRPGTRWIDGSIFADLPMEALAETYGVDRHVASMVNPMVLPFITHAEDDGDALHWMAGLGVQWTRAVVTYGTSMMMPLLSSALPRAALALETWQRIVGQRYRADVTITPNQRFHDPRNLIAHVSPDEIRVFVEEGERAAQRRVPMVRAAIGIEHALTRFE